MQQIIEVFGIGLATQFIPMPSAHTRFPHPCVDKAATSFWVCNQQPNIIPHTSPRLQCDMLPDSASLRLSPICNKHESHIPNMPAQFHQTIAF